METIHKIVRKLIPKYGQHHKFNKSQNNHVDNDLYERIKDKPVLIAFGKGNGKTTISNLRNKGPKGPVKTLALELSKYSLVVLVDEYNTSKICSECLTEKLEHPQVKKTIMKRRKDENNKVYKEKVEVIRDNYKLCHCKNEIHQINNKTSDVHKIWNRDYNASKSQIQVMCKKLTGENLGLFKRKKLSDKPSEDDIIISCSQEQLEPN